METEGRNYKTELILAKTGDITGNIYNLKRMHNKKLYQIGNNFLKVKNIYRNHNTEPKYKVFGTQTVDFTNSKITKTTITPLNKNKKNKKILFNEIKNICDNIYESNNNQNNNFRTKLREDIIKSIDNYIFSDLRKNILFPKMIKTKKNKEIKLKEIKVFKVKEKEKGKEKTKEKEKKERSFDSNKVSMKDILNNYDCNSSHRRVKVYRYKYGDYAKNNTKYNHPQLYTLNNIFRTRNIFPSIGPQKALNTFHDFTNLIPEKRINKSEFNKQIYKAYKTMKTKNINEKGILI